MKHLYNTLIAILMMGIGIAHAQITVDATAGTSSANYSTLKAAFDAINNGTHQGVIDIRVHANTTETDSCRLEASGFGGVSSYTSIVIRPADTATVAKTISIALSGTSLVYLNGADNLTFDGRPMGIGTQKFLTFSHTNPNAHINSCSIRMINGVSNVTLQNINSVLNTTTATTACINISLSTSAATVGNSGISILDCNITGGVQGINMTGTLANFMDNITIRRNNITNAQGSGIIASAVKTLIIDSNTLTHTASFTGWNVFGLNLNPNVSAGVFTITKNNIFNLQTGSAAQMAGVLLSPGTASLAVNPIVTMTNNNVSMMSTNTGLTFARAMQFQGAGNITFVCNHNTFRLGGSGAGTAGNPATIAFAKSNSATATSYTFNNNLCINTRTGAANPHVGYWNSTPTTGTNNTNFNNMYGPVFPAIANGFYQSDITAYRAASVPNEQNSTFGLLDFVNAGSPDLTLTGINNTGAKLQGTPSSVTTDFYGTTRDLTNPFKGAFEGPTSLVTSNDLQTVIIYTFGKIPTGTVDTVRAIVRNVGTAAAVNVPISLYSSLHGFIGSVLVNIPSGLQTTINVAPYTPTILGFDTLLVFPPADQLAANDTSLWVRENTLNALSYSRPFVNQTGNVGTNPAGEIVAKFTTPVPNFVNQVNVNFTNAGTFTSNQFQIVIYPDSGGALGPKMNPIYVSSTQNTVNGIFNLSLPSVPVSGSFYLGVRQISANNIGFAYQNENPIRNATFYFRQGATFTTLAWNDFAVNATNQFRFMIEPRLKINDDLGVIDVLSPAMGCADTSSTKQVRVTVQNLGLLTQDFSLNNLQVFGSITNPANVTTNFGPVTVNSGTLASDDTVSVVLAPSYNMGATGNYTIKAWSQFALDNNKVNDTLPNTVRIVTIPTTVPYSQSFNAALTFPVELSTNRFAVTAGIGTNSSNAARVNLFSATPFNANAQIILPRVVASALSMCRFDYKITDFTTAGATVLTNVDSMNVYISTDCGFSYTNVYTLVGSSHTPSTEYATVSIPLGAYVGQNVRIKIQFDWFGTTNDANVDIDNIRIINISDDLSAISTSQPCRALLLGSAPINPQAVFKNTGNNALAGGTTVNYVITGPVSYSGTGTLSATAAGDLSTVSFNPAFNPTAVGTYSVKVFSSLSTDSDHLNDTLLYTFNVTNTAQTNAGNALVFSGTNFAQVANSSSINLSTSSLTLEAWVLRDAAGTGNRTIINKDSSILKGQYAFWINLSNNLVFSITTSAGSNAVVSANAIPSAIWTHVAAVYDGTTIVLYINGKIEASTAHTGTIVPSATVLNIGQNYASADRFVGSMDELKIWNSARTTHEIRQNIHTRLANASSPNLVGYYRMDEGSGSIVVDASGNCNAVRLAAAAPPTWSVATYPLTSTPLVAMQQVLADGVPYAFTGTNISLAFFGVTGQDSIYVHKFTGAPIGNSPTGVTAVHGNYWIAYKYGLGTFTSVEMTTTLGAGNLGSGVVTGDLVLFSRENGSSGAWTATTATTTSVSFASQSATFTNTTNSVFDRQLAVGGNNNPLPVELLYFNAKNNKMDVDLAWATASETDNAGFHIERSVNGKDFEEIDYVKGHGNSNEQVRYTLRDEKAFAVTGVQTLYYRLVQKDFSGKTETSQTVSISVDDMDEPAIAVYPNPFTAETNIQIDASSSSDIRISVTDITGKEVSAMHATLQKGINILPTDGLSTLSKGLYMIRIVTAGGEVTTHKLVKQ